MLVGTLSTLLFCEFCSLLLNSYNHCYARKAKVSQRWPLTEDQECCQCARVSAGTKDGNGPLKKSNLWAPCLYLKANGWSAHMSAITEKSCNILQPLVHTQTLAPLLLNKTQGSSNGMQRHRLINKCLRWNDLSPLHLQSKNKAGPKTITSATDPLQANLISAPSGTLSSSGWAKGRAVRVRLRLLEQ